jgi:hypothetical protein
MRIDKYSFGKIVIGNKTYTSDIIIYPDRIDPSWWRKEGHLLQVNDLSDVLKENPDLIIIGTGYSGVMRISEDVKKFLKSKEIDVIIEKTPEAVDAYNKIFETKKTIACLHLTC